MDLALRGRREVEEGASWQQWGSAPPTPSIIAGLLWSPLSTALLCRFYWKKEFQCWKAVPDKYGPSQAQRYGDSCYVFIPAAALAIASQISIFFWSFFLFGSCFSRICFVCHPVIPFWCIQGELFLVLKKITEIINVHCRKIIKCVKEKRWLKIVLHFYHPEKATFTI